MKAADRILLLGHRGLLGRAIMSLCPREVVVIEGGRQRFDLARLAQEPGQGPPNGQGDRELLLELIGRQRPQVMINCAAYTDVDRAEREPELAWRVNALAAEALARICAQSGVHLVHMSTDYVFSGRAARPYTESDAPDPLNAYGASKLESEKRVAAALPSALVVRSAWLFGPGQRGFVDLVLARAREGRPVKAAVDQVGSPTYSLDLAGALVELARRRQGGLLHVVNSGQASRLELARRALSLAGLDPGQVQGVKSEELGLAARRPAFGVLDTSRYNSLGKGPLAPWSDALERHLSRLGKEVQA